MSEKNHPETKEENHIDEEDLKRAAKRTEKEVPLAANEKDAYVSDTELKNPSDKAKKAAEENDPTAGRSATQ